MSLGTVHCLVCDVRGGDNGPDLQKGRQADKASFSSGDVRGVFIMCFLVKKRYESAYFTVEAALILPIAMLFTIMMIFLAFYSYDRCVMEHSAYEAALRGTSHHFGTAEEAESAARTAAAGLVSEKLFAMHDFSYDVSVDAKSVTVTYHCVVNMPFITWLNKYIPEIDMTREVSRSASRLNPARTIRDCRILNHLITEQD